MPRTSFRPAASIALVVLAAATTVVACTTDPAVDTPAARPRPTADTVDAPYGALEPRLAAVEALAGRRAPLTLRMVRSTIEGRPVVFVLAVWPGAALLVIDERADGGGVRSHALAQLRLVRQIPSRWLNDAEVEKERLEPVADASDARRTPGTYLLVHPRCLAGPCAEVF